MAFRFITMPLFMATRLSLLLLWVLLSTLVWGQGLTMRDADSTISMGEDVTLARTGANTLTLSGNLLLGAGAPTQPTQACSKQYTDDQVASVASIVPTLSNSIDSPSTITAASSAAAKAAYDQGTLALATANSAQTTANAAIPVSALSPSFSSTSSTSHTTHALNILIIIY